jgi:GMP synthase-like glutamine amidotransferase
MNTPTQPKLDTTVPKAGGSIILGRPYRVMIVGGGYDYIKFFFDDLYHGSRNIDETDIFVFTGGEDVTPSMYGEKALKQTFSNPERDLEEKIIFKQALEKGIPMVGICRGGQFLNVMSGGSLWQHVNNHGGQHAIKEVLPKGSNKEARSFIVTSTHHQMMIPHKSARVLAVGCDADGLPLADQRMSYGREFVGKDPKRHPDYEVLWYEKTKCLCFQPHPEFNTAPKACKEYFLELMEEFIHPVAP